MLVFKEQESHFSFRRSNHSLLNTQRPAGYQPSIKRPLFVATVIAEFQHQSVTVYSLLPIYSLPISEL